MNLVSGDFAAKSSAVSSRCFSVFESDPSGFKPAPSTIAYSGCPFALGCMPEATARPEAMSTAMPRKLSVCIWISQKSDTFPGVRACNQRNSTLPRQTRAKKSQIQLCATSCLA